MRKLLLLITILVCCSSSAIFAHCQVPCGIYTDDLRFSIMNEHAETILKSMKQIEELAKAKQPDMNQIVRWTTTKDAHADDIINICSHYFLCQRLKSVDSVVDEKAKAKLLKQLNMVHQIMVVAMKCKQSTDVEQVKKLEELLHNFAHAYGAHKH